ncbi:MAG: Superoxide dismutase [Cu-Zn] precursor, partial [uncultured Sphingomonadaceae bacterium]
GEIGGRPLGRPLFSCPTRTRARQPRRGRALDLKQDAEDDHALDDAGPARAAGARRLRDEPGSRDGSGRRGADRDSDACRRAGFSAGRGEPDRHSGRPAALGGARARHGTRDIRHPRSRGRALRPARLRQRGTALEPSRSAARDGEPGRPPRGRPAQLGDRGERDRNARRAAPRGARPPGRGRRGGNHPRRGRRLPDGPVGQQRGAARLRGVPAKL